MPGPAQHIATAVLDGMPRRWRPGREVILQATDSRTVRIFVCAHAHVAFYEVAERNGSYELVYSIDNNGTFRRRTDLSLEQVVEHVFDGSRERTWLGSRLRWSKARRRRSLTPPVHAAEPSE